MSFSADAAAAARVGGFEARDGGLGAGVEGAEIEGGEGGCGGGEIRRRGGGGGGGGEELEGVDFGDGEDVVVAWLGGGGGRRGGCGWWGTGVDGDEVGDGAGGEEGSFEGVVGGEGGGYADAVMARLVC